MLVLADCLGGSFRARAACGALQLETGAVGARRKLVRPLGQLLHTWKCEHRRAQCVWMCAPRVLARQGPRKGRCGRLGTSALGRAGVSLAPLFALMAPKRRSKETPCGPPFRQYRTRAYAHGSQRHLRVVAGALNLAPDPWVWKYVQAVEAATPAHGGGRLELGLRSVGVGVRSGSSSSDTCAWWRGP